MNSKQRRARIRAGMPGVVHRILTMKLMGDLTDTTAERYLTRLQDKRLRFADFEKTVRAVAELERQAGLRKPLKTFFPTLPRTAWNTIVFDEVTQIK